MFEECIDLHADSLYRVAYRLTGCSDLAEELVQETYLNAWKGISSLKDESKMRSWMFSILHNQYRKLLSRISNTRQIADSGLVEIASQELAVTDERFERVQWALERLGEDQKLALLLVSMEGLSVDAAAEVMQVPRGTVLSRLHRGREKIKQLLNVEAVSTQDGSSLKLKNEES